MNRLETNRRRPTPDTVFRLEAALGLEPCSLVPGWPEWSPIGKSSYGGMSRERRRELGLSLSQVASAAGVDAATLSRFERELGKSSLMERVALPSGGQAVLPREALSIALGFKDAQCHAAYCWPR